MYLGIGPEKGNEIEKEDAYPYALNRCLNGTIEEREEFRDMLVEWYFSGNWIEEEEDEQSNS